ncbi:TPA: phosphate ABC transporter substrate-binding protein, partial [Enterobacter cloacae]
MANGCDGSGKRRWTSPYIPGVNRRKDMNNRLAFPMYAVDSTDTLALWRAVQRLLVARGLPV